MNRVVECGLTYNFGEVQRRRRQMDRNSRSGGDMEMGCFRLSRSFILEFVVKVPPL